jgi:ABC-type antimicrobial peptide transport system permease subunit
MINLECSNEPFIHELNEIRIIKISCMLKKRIWLWSRIIRWLHKNQTKQDFKEIIACYVLCEDEGNKVIGYYAHRQYY